MLHLIPSLRPDEIEDPQAALELARAEFRAAIVRAQDALLEQARADAAYRAAIIRAHAAA